MSDLVKRLRSGYVYYQNRKLCSEAAARIEQLEAPVMPDEVVEILADLRDAGTELFNLESTGYANDVEKAADLLERLEQENETLLHAIRTRDSRMVSEEKRIYKLENERVELQHRIEELEAPDVPGYWISLIDAAREQRDSFKSQRDQLAEALEVWSDIHDDHQLYKDFKRIMEKKT